MRPRRAEVRRGRPRHLNPTMVVHLRAPTVGAQRTRPPRLTLARSELRVHDTTRPMLGSRAALAALRKDAPVVVDVIRGSDGTLLHARMFVFATTEAAAAFASGQARR